MPEEKSLTREDLEYMFNTAAEKFFKTFNAAKAKPAIAIQNVTVSGETDVKKINEELAKMIQESAGAATGGRYSEKPCNPPKNIKDLKITLLGHELKYVSKLSFEGMRAKLDFWWGGEGDKEGSFSVDVPCNWVTLAFKK